MPYLWLPRQYPSIKSNTHDKVSARLSDLGYEYISLLLRKSLMYPVANSVPASILVRCPTSPPHSHSFLAVLLSASLAALVAVFLALPAYATGLDKRVGWEVFQTDKPYEILLGDVLAAVKTEGLIVVTQAGPTKAAAARGITIPGNRVIGIFNNDYAVRILTLSSAAMIEAPIRLYVTEGVDGGATLSYKKPSHVFTPYFNEGGIQLMRIAAELDQRFASIARMARQ